MISPPARGRPARSISFFSSRTFRARDPGEPPSRRARPGRAPTRRDRRHRAGPAIRGCPRAVAGAGSRIGTPRLGSGSLRTNRAAPPARSDSWRRQPEVDLGGVGDTMKLSSDSIVRRSLACMPAGISPISSRKTVPPVAASKSPRRSWFAPVNAPLQWPKSSLSSRASDSAAQFTARKGAAARRPESWMPRATSSFPVPVSPSIRMARSEALAFRTRSKTSSIAALSPRSTPSSMVARTAVLGCLCRSFEPVSSPCSRRSAPRSRARSHRRDAGTSDDDGRPFR